MIKSLVDVIIDPGHGGKDNGAQWGYVDEKDLNLLIARELADTLKGLGFGTMLTRVDDYTVTLKERVAIVNTLNARAFISIHCDAYHNTTASGMSVHVCPGSPKGRDLGGHIQKGLMSAFPGHYHRGVIESDFYVLKKTRMPAALVECEFLSNPTTRAFLRDPAHQSELALAIAGGVLGVGL